VLCQTDSLLKKLSSAVDAVSPYDYTIFYLTLLVLLLMGQIGLSSVLLGFDAITTVSNLIILLLFDAFELY
jgi:membrane-anchored protein YejM (alkaline phosphatase superfamily)